MAAADNFSGSEEFDVKCSSFENGSPVIQQFNGGITGGVISGGPASFVLVLDLVEGSDPLNVTLSQAQLRNDSHRVGGGLRRCACDDQKKAENTGH